MIGWLVNLLVFILPAYVANSSPVLFGGGTPVDFGRNAWDRRRILGDGKTLRGLIAGIACGMLTGAAEATLFHDPSYYMLGAALSIGAVTGDLAGSFIKRRIGMKRGKPAFLLDQLPFLAVALALAAPIRMLSPLEIGALALITYLLHVGTNFAANRLGLKSVPW